MPRLNKDGSTRKKYTTKKMIMKKNRKSGQKKAWDTRKALYPETNGYKPKQVEFEATKMPMSAPVVLEDEKKSDNDLMGDKNWRDYVSESLKHPQGMETESSKKN